MPGSGDRPRRTTGGIREKVARLRYGTLRDLEKKLADEETPHEGAARPGQECC